MVQKKIRSSSVRKKKGKYSFHLSFAGIAGIGIVIFCLFFWMFLIGIWAGQTILLPVSDNKKNSVQMNVPEGNTHIPQTLEAEGKKKKPAS